MDDTSQLLKEYPTGQLRDEIAMSRADVLENWSELQRMVEDRKERLLAAADYHHFQASVSIGLESLPSLLMLYNKLEFHCLVL